jgi:hypothetical protein
MFRGDIGETAYYSDYLCLDTVMLRLCFSDARQMGK